MPNHRLAPPSKVHPHPRLPNPRIGSLRHQATQPSRNRDQWRSRHVTSIASPDQGCNSSSSRVNRRTTKARPPIALSQSRRDGRSWGGTEPPVPPDSIVRLWLDRDDCPLIDSGLGNCACGRAFGEQQGARRVADEPCIRDSSGTMARVRIAHVSAKNSRTPCVRRRPSRCADHRSPARWLPPAPGGGS